MRKMLFITLLMGGLCTTVSVAKAQERLPEYLQAEKYTQEKLNTMLFSTVVDPHWFQKGNNFWFEYKTSEGTFWYVVDPAARTKKLLFDRDELASQLTEIVKDPFEARHLPITNLKAEEDGRTFTFEVKSTKDATPKKDGKDKLDNIFNRFESGKSYNSLHTGIGLNLSKLIIEAHHGSVSVNNNEDGRGVSFRIIIPKYNMKRKAK